MKKLSIFVALSLGLSACGESGSDTDKDPIPDSSSTLGWQLVWSDEFDGDSIDTSKWSHEQNCTGGGNNELQCYTANPTNSYVDNGLLHLVAKKESVSGPATVDDDPSYNPADTSVNRDYSSARLRTKAKGDWRYGRMEIRAKLPQGQGIWPAIWMLPTQWQYGGWPASGEIDIMEAVNSNTGNQPNDIHGTLHYGKFSPENSYTGAAKTVVGNAWEAQHTYAVEWEQNEIRWYLDGVHYASQRPATETTPGWFTYYWQGQTAGYSFGDQGAPFDEQFHLILNLAVGGNWPGVPNSDTQFPQTFSIDYVRVYQCAPQGNVAADGSGCASDVDANITAIGNQRPAQKSYSLYNNGVQNFNFEILGEAYTQGLNLLAWSAVDGDVAIEHVEEGDSTLWQVTYYGTGNSYLSFADSPNGNALTGAQLRKMSQYGEFKFDLKILSAEAGTEIKVKLDSGWPNVSEFTLPALEHNQWHSLSVPFSQLVGNSVEAGQVNYDAVLNPFVIEANGPAQIQINNLRILCLASCDLAPRETDAASEISETVSIFDETVNGLWNLGLLLWETASPHVVIDVADAADTNYGKVIDVQFTGTDKNGLVFIQTDRLKNMTAFSASGYLEFEINVLDYAAATSLNIKADCVNPCSSGDINIGQPGMNGWETVQVPVSDLVAGGLDLSKVNTPFALLPAWGEQAGVHLQLDNIQWVLP